MATTISPNLLTLINQAEVDLQSAVDADGVVTDKQQLVLAAQNAVNDAQKVVDVSKQNAVNLHQTANTSAQNALAQLKTELGIP